MLDDVPPINEIVGLLTKYSPVALRELNSKYPGNEALLRAGQLAGPRTDRQTRLRAEAAVAGLRAAAGVCDRLIPRIRAKLSGGNKLQLAGQLMSVLGGASIFGLLAMDYPRAAKYAAAVLALLGVVASLAAQFLTAPIHKDAGSLFDVYNTLVESNLSARQLLSELEPWVASGFAGQSKADLITRSNEVCFSILKAESRVP